MTSILWKWFRNTNLFHTEFLSIQQHNPRHTDQSRDYRECGFYSVQSTDVYNLDQTIHHCILFFKFKLHDWHLNAVCIVWWLRNCIKTLHNVIYKNYCYVLESNLLVLHVNPVHPGLHPAHTPVCILHVLYLQLVGHDSLHLLPYTSDRTQP